MPQRVFGSVFRLNVTESMIPVYSGYSVTLPLSERGVDQLRRADVLLVLDLEALRLERLLVELAEHELLGEVLRADDDRRRLRLGLAAGAAAAPPRTIATPSAIVNAAFAARRLCLRITASPFREWLVDVPRSEDPTAGHPVRDDVRLQRMGRRP